MKIINAYCTIKLAILSLVLPRGGDLIEKGNV